MNTRVLTLLSVLALLQNSVTAQISITGQTSYHKASYGSAYGVLESGTVDNGGVITLFVRNDGAATDSLADVKISKNGVYDTARYAVWWPLEMLPGETTSIWLKGIATPFAPGDTVLLEAHTTSGFTAQQTFINQMPGLRIANMIPSYDRSTLWVYLRNDETTNVVFTNIDFNDATLAPGNAALTIVGGSTTIKPGDVAILKIQTTPQTLAILKPVRLNVRYQNGNSNKNVSAFERLVPAEFPIGTWHSPTANNNEEEGRKRLRKLAITSVFGPNNVNDMNANLPEYYMKVVREADFSNNGSFDPANAAQYVTQNNNNPLFHYWNVDDEPDLNNKPIAEELIKNLTYWKSDDNTPSYVNLASQKNFQRYGFYTDVVSMDHYSDDGPPCVIPFPYWYTTEGSVREAIEYTVQLKKNTEPKRMNTWSQLISNAFSNQAETHVINFQFWAHVSAGAKGIHFFTAKPNHLDDEPALWQESEKLTHQLNGIKNLCLYSEPWSGVTVNSGNVIAKSLVGEDALTIVLLNNSIDYTSVNIINHEWTSTVSPVQFDIQVTVPDWIPLDQFYETDENGKFGITSITNIGGRTYRITGTINERSKVFVIGKNDTQSPQQITEINVSDKSTPISFTLSWNEPTDNFGVKGYYIKADNYIIDSVKAPIWESDNKMNACLIGYWSVIPYDDAHNLGQPAVITIDWSSVGSGTPLIYQEPTAQTVSAGAWAAFTIADSASTGNAYLWQVDTGNGVWTDLQNNSQFSGVYTSTLSVFAHPDFNNNNYRCIVWAGCNQNRDTSTSAAITVIGGLSVTDLVNAGVKLFPNPSNGTFTISNDTDEPLSVLISDNTGRIIRNSAILNKAEKKIMSELSSGVYQVVFQNSDGHVFTKRAVVF